jgi:hypothetical protein
MENNQDTVQKYNMQGMKLLKLLNTFMWFKNQNFSLNMDVHT